MVIKDSGKREEYGSGMVRDTQDNKPKFSLLMPEGVPYEEQPLYKIAMHYTNGAKKYDDRNWELANSKEELNRFKDSAFRHFMAAMAGANDEDHKSAVVFNMIAWMYMEWKLNNSPIDELK